jgi:hypothetical protein
LELVIFSSLSAGPIHKYGNIIILRPPLPAQKQHLSMQADSASLQKFDTVLIARQSLVSEIAEQHHIIQISCEALKVTSPVSCPTHAPNSLRQA